MLPADFLRYLDELFNVQNYPPDEQGGLYRASDQPIHRLGFLLEPFPGINDWISAHQLDALWIHRPWQLDLTSLPPQLGIFYHHLPFDEHLTLGYNSYLAEAMNLTSLEPIGYKQAPDLQARPIGMLGAVPVQSVDSWLASMLDVFGGYEAVTGNHQLVPERVAVVGAMNDALVREAANRGVGLYITGQYRQPASKAVQETGISVISIGHQRSEEWGLRALVQLVESKWPTLEVQFKA
ncbi:Nif3-like dinuclear metal center hexameric protein [Tellurirhabdus bombi]|uniref:Nif3-like dinuclear metal center hexameric protein n=1 Tax=Tellurirhabdus bombi TaxID=2907205 RepID=UPI001F35F791|nr:Nif3-like dinuclear metal center hexameric protein [Tellurirhabdus bombi]